MKTLKKLINKIYRSRCEDSFLIETRKKKVVNMVVRPEKGQREVETVDAQWRFLDNLRTVDFVLVWDGNRSKSASEENQMKRETFEKNLQEEGLEIEKEYIAETNLHFIKIHAPIKVLRRYAQILKLRLPMKALHTKTQLDNSNETSCLHCIISSFVRVFSYNTAFPEPRKTLTTVYSQDKEYLFDWKKPGFFNPQNKSRIVRYILDRTFFGESIGHDMFSFGIERMIQCSAYKAAYPLHDGDLLTPGSMRHKLRIHWALLKNWYHYQPIDYIRNYFGVKIGLYFAWLGFYTVMLIPASIVGLACFLVSTFLLPSNKPLEDICSESLNVTMCPLCDHDCDFWKLSETCFYAKVTFLFDNYTTLFFAVFMSFWAATFLEMWKRYALETTHRWDLTKYNTQEDENPRPQYLVRLARLDVNRKAQIHLKALTHSEEPKVPFWKMMFPAKVLSFSGFLLLMLLSIATIISLILYRITVKAALFMHGDSVVTSYAIIITTTTAAFLNLISILFFKWLYTKIATRLTELELPRTQYEFENALNLKMYLLQFVNHYASLIYIAFFKGYFVGSPSHHHRLFGFRMEECSPGGCLVELSIQLAIIMVGKQVFTTCLEVILPKALKWWVSKKVVSMQYRNSQWVKDYTLKRWGPQALYHEYLEMILQYGFVTIFVSAFPLAPLFALLNNIVETRLDAQKLLFYHRRPVAQRVKNIGVWYTIIDNISKLAVVSNAFIIAFTTDFVARLVYVISVSPNGSLTGYVNHSLAFMNTSDLDMPSRFQTNLQYCRFKQYREPPWSLSQYQWTKMFWHVLAAKFAFVVVFQNLIHALVVGLRWLIPDIPDKLRKQINEENYLTDEIIFAHDTARASNKSFPDLKDEDSIRRNQPAPRETTNSDNKRTTNNLHQPRSEVNPNQSRSKDKPAPSSKRVIPNNIILI